MFIVPFVPNESGPSLARLNMGYKILKFRFIFEEGLFVEHQNSAKIGELALKMVVFMIFTSYQK